MNSYELSRAWFDFSFDNPEKIKPSHSAVYFFAIEHCNRLGWKEKFGFPSQMVMEAVGIKNWRTYSGVLNDLVGFGFIRMLEISKNQYSANIIAIVNNTKATTTASTKALDKALQKHSTKQRQSTVSIVKQETKNKEQETISLPDCIDIDLWNCFIDARKANKKAMTEEAKKRAIKKLEGFECKALGAANISLDNSIVSGWAGVFMPKDDELPQSTESKSTFKRMK
jgi:hypothetical protein